MPRNRKPLPALDNASKVNNPDLPNIYDRNYTDIILKYGGLATRFPQLNTNAKTVVDAINELQAGGQGDGKHRTLTLAEYDALSEEEKNNGTIYFITDAPSVYIRPEDLAATDALPGQLLAFYSDYGDYGVWTATSQIRNLQEGDVLLWDSQHQTWINGQISVGKSALKDLTDVDINTVLNNQILKYDETSHKWVNADNTSGVNELSELEDVDLGNLQSGQVLTYIGDYWVNSDFNLSDIEDVNITNPQNSQVLKYNSLTQTWVNADDSGDVSELADLDDVELSTPQENQILRYTRLRGSNQSYYYRWVNTNLPDTYMSDIEDVYLTSLQNYQILQYDTNNWRNIDFTLSNLQDTAISNPTNGQYLIYDGTNWVNADGGGGGGASSLSELNDVDLDEPTLTEGQLLYYNGSEWVNYEYFALGIGQYSPEDGDILIYVKEDEDAPGVWQNFSIADAIELSKLGDVVIDDSDLQSGQVLTYNGSEWVNASGGGGGASDLSDLNDVTITSPTNGQVLTYDSLNDEWVNANASGGASSADQVSYDNTTSGLVADDVQEAIDEVVDDLDDKAEYVELTQLEYDALSPAEKGNGTLYFITDANGDGSQFQPIIYSTTEREIGVWIDGKPLYEKTVYNAGGTSGYINIAHSISNLGVCVDAFGTCHDVGYGVPLTGVCDMPIARIGGDNNDIGICGVDTTNVIFSVPSAFQQRIVDIYITIRYTKSSDTAGSGIWTPQGVPTVHYSTDEHIIGTWVDGSTLYEKTFEVDNIYVTDGGYLTIDANFSHNVKIGNGYVINSVGTVYCLPDGRGRIFKDANGLRFQSINGGSWGGNLFVTIQYTKSSS